MQDDLRPQRQGAPADAVGLARVPRRLDCKLGLEQTYGLGFGATCRRSSRPPQRADRAARPTSRSCSPPTARSRPTTCSCSRTTSKLFPPYNVSLVVNDKAAEAAGPDLPKIVAQVQQDLSTKVMQELNSRVDLDKEKPAAVARAYLRAVRLHGVRPPARRYVAHVHRGDRRLQVQLLHPAASRRRAPAPGDAGSTCAASRRSRSRPASGAVVPTGVAVALPEGVAGLVVPRSGLAARHGISVVNGPGLIDPTYRGEIRVVLVNLGAEPYHGEVGDRIAQLLLVPFVAPRRGSSRRCRLRRRRGPPASALPGARRPRTSTAHRGEGAGCPGAPLRPGVLSSWQSFRQTPHTPAPAARTHLLPSRR